MHNKFEKLVWDAQLAVCILGNPQTSDFILIDLTAPLRDMRSEISAQRGLYFLGAAGIIQGAPRTALAEPLDNAAVDALAGAYVRHVESVLASRISKATVPLQNDSETWLWRLWSLKDTRPDA
jgi:hypothetical protein